MSPTLTVCTAVFNDEMYLTRALDSVAAQSRQPDQYVVVDDGSTDRCPQIIADFARRHDFVLADRNPRNLGHMEAARRTHELAEGDYIFGFASDDRVLPGFFEKIMEAAALYPDAGVIFGGYRVIDESGEDLGETGMPHLEKTTYIPPERYRQEVLETMSPDWSPSAATIYRRDVLNAIDNYRPELGSWADTFAIHTIGMRNGACYVPTCGIAWTRRKRSFSQTTVMRPKLALDIVARSAVLMRSEEFKSLYPEDFVRSWEKRARASIINRQASIFWHQVMDCFEDQTRAIETTTVTDRLWTAAASIVLRMGIKIRKLQIRRNLSPYQGDTSWTDRPGP